MPIHPYDPAMDEEEGRKAPDLGDVIRRILGDEEDPARGPASPSD